ncbi:hypothetical protein A8L34_02390 [Bacillus sp. FJAT-27264]|uniref:hypothetical protein n=1 Tax=Paenibacillus sp. (strain DSM 101736 / FJAT-27264) TaxID=1850362 RepID=UPI000807E9E0|nr:hypothetical protein [Bacillus sp. FJAT-27264]OBZ18453.1 hypothetical protein A8L34_02390 [Bacillus sp. FJAT-27264]
MLKSTTTFTKLIGIAFIILSILRLTPIINATGKWLLCVGIAALFLILSDLCEFIIEGIIKREGIQWDRTLEVLRLIFLVFAVMAIIVLPNIKIKISVSQVNAFSDAVSLAGLGIAITLIGFKTERAHKRLLKKQFEKIAGRTHETSNQ